MAQATQDHGGFRAADHGLATAPFGAQRRIPKDGEPGPDPWRGADHGGACGSGADQEHSVSDGSEDPEGLPSDTSDRRSSGLANSRFLPETSPRVIPWNHPWGEGPCMPSASAD